jgi:hypothetical protein
VNTAWQVIKERLKGDMRKEMALLLHNPSLPQDDEGRLAFIINAITCLLNHWGCHSVLFNQSDPPAITSAIEGASIKTTRVTVARIALVYYHLSTDWKKKRATAHTNFIMEALGSLMIRRPTCQVTLPAFSSSAEELKAVEQLLQDVCRAESHIDEMVLSIVRKDLPILRQFCRAKEAKPSACRLRLTQGLVKRINDARTFHKLLWLSSGLKEPPRSTNHPSSSNSPAVGIFR